ncbi:hypothetical protein [Actinomadura roseirufa]|uniref:hypothetical protein n=1 Tax=Actinomadura roseirufa TaxID=2094049 RepID=UPI0013F1574F|nr:hypothetical protein [Actinomadura roseirufa]
MPKTAEPLGLLEPVPRSGHEAVHTDAYTAPGLRRDDVPTVGDVADATVTSVTA